MERRKININVFTHTFADSMDLEINELLTIINKAKIEGSETVDISIYSDDELEMSFYKKELESDDAFDLRKKNKEASQRVIERIERAKYLELKKKFGD